MEATARSHMARQELLQLDEQLLTAKLSLQSDALHSSAYAAGMHADAPQAKSPSPPASNGSEQPPAMAREHAVTDAHADVVASTMAAEKAPQGTTLFIPPEAHLPEPGLEDAGPPVHPVTCSSSSGVPSDLLRDSFGHLAVDRRTSSDRTSGLLLFRSSAGGGAGDPHVCEQSSSIGACYTIATSNSSSARHELALCQNIPGASAAPATSAEEFRCSQCETISSSVDASYTIARNSGHHEQTTEQTRPGTSVVVVPFDTHVNFQQRDSISSSVDVSYTISSSPSSAAAHELAAAPQVADTSANAGYPPPSGLLSPSTDSQQCEFPTHARSAIDSPQHGPAARKVDSLAWQRVPELYMPHRCGYSVSYHGAQHLANEEKCRFCSKELQEYKKADGGIDVTEDEACAGTNHLYLCFSPFSPEPAVSAHEFTSLLFKHLCSCCRCRADGTETTSSC